MTKTPQFSSSRRGFTLIEILVASSIMAAGMVIALPVLRGMVGTSQATGSSAQARALVTAVNIYRARTGTAITGVAVKPMSLMRANQIYAQIDGPLPNGEVIVETGFVLDASATFPASWGELSPGIFDPVQ